MIAGLLFDSWSFYKRHILAILALMLPVVVPVEILTLVWEQSFAKQEYQWLTWAITSAAYPLYAVAIIFYIASVVSGEYLPPKSLWLLGVKYWLPFLLLNLISGIVIVLGLLLLVVPGIIISIRFAFSQFELLFNRLHPLDAMRVSWDKTKQHMWLIFVGYCVISAVIYLPYLAITYLLGKAGVAILAVDSLLNIVCTVADVFYVIFAFRVYEFAKSKVAPVDQ